MRRDYSDETWLLLSIGGLALGVALLAMCSGCTVIDQRNANGCTACIEQQDHGDDAPIAEPLFNIGDRDEIHGDVAGDKKRGDLGVTR